MSDASDLYGYSPYLQQPTPPPAPDLSLHPGVPGAVQPGSQPGRGGDYIQPPTEMEQYNAGVLGSNYGMTPGTPGAPDYWAMAFSDVRNGNSSKAKWLPDQGMYQSGGNPGDESAIDQGAWSQWNAWQNSRFKNQFQNSDLETNMQRIGQAATPDPTKLSYLPGAAPDTVFDIQTGDVFRFGNNQKYTMVGNVTLPQYNELQRGSALVMANLHRNGLLAPAVPKPLRGDYGWHSQTSPKVPSLEALRGIDVNNPTLDDIANNLSNASGTVWAQVDRSTKRAIGLGSVFATFLGGVGGGLFAPAAAGGAGLAGEGLGGVAAGAGAGVAGSSLGMLAGQIAGHGGKIEDVDWPAVVRSAIAGGIGAGVGVGLGAAGLQGPAKMIGTKLADIAASRGLGAVFPSAPTDIRAYQPYPGMSPAGAGRLINRYPVY